MKKTTVVYETPSRMRRLRYSVLFGCLAILLWGAGVALVRAQESMKAPIQAGVEVTQYLPPEMYGHWSVRASLMESNQPALFSKQVNDIWTLDRINDQVVVTNPVTGAWAAVQVDQVTDDTATFHRVVTVSTKKRFVESPTVTVKGDKLYGVTIDKIELLSQGRVVQSYYGKYLLEAERVAGARVQFGDRPPSDALEFPIDDSQLQPDGAKR